MVYFFQTRGIGYLAYFLGSTYLTVSEYSLLSSCVLLHLIAKQAVGEATTICPRKMTADLLTVKVVSESRVTWATSANFSLPRPLCSRLRPDVRDRQTSDAHHRLMPSP